MTSALLILPHDDPKKLRSLASEPITTVIAARPGKIREALDEVCKHATVGSFDLLIVRTIRITGVRRLLEVLAHLARCGATVRSLDEPYLDIQAQGPFVNLLSEMLAQERREAIAQGRARAAAEGRRPGRPRVQVPPEAFQMLDQGESVKAVALKTRIGASTLRRAAAARRVLHPSPGAEVA